MVDVKVGPLGQVAQGDGIRHDFPQRERRQRVGAHRFEGAGTGDAGIALRLLVRLGQMTVELIEKDDLRSQLKQLVWNSELDLSSGFSLCVCCNEPLHPID